ncbi:CRISPR-associated protein Cas4 [Bacillus aquiflavi]|uniref:CRISPR-associated exonuclease Cas4 n=1 Tax=Bacillus aquiflavi TaxID=2672567 RepID=A0A6B3VVL9_9BACI|nr:CRISPR-associated protein Cas4 [Bacillus aquiflavi]MBA4537823.1 CRISPR-associated protein Cas4 [Bacillus aquiflavi]NEY82079.1 CRISPR-associated protein Cas4 [Bacillus aquiflavi]UAC48355.1 CRISPR-associated protein Cas4 [Bacillus aquiflavi]
MEVQASAITAYAFCPRRCYYEYVDHVFFDNVYTKHGSLLHQHVDKEGIESRDNRLLTRSLYLFSEKYQLSVRCDVVEERDGKVYPVEYKRGKDGDWKNNLLQLCAQAIALEEYTKNTIKKGYLYFYGSNKRREVEFNEQLRQETITVIKKIRDLDKQEKPPKGINDPRRCSFCSLFDYCMPFETEKLKGEIDWERYI